MRNNPDNNQREGIFELANSVDPDEMPHNAAFNLCLLCLQLYLQINYALTE